MDRARHAMADGNVTALTPATPVAVPGDSPPSSPFVAISSGGNWEAISKGTIIMPTMDTTTAGAGISAGTDQAVQIGVPTAGIISEGEAATGEGHCVAMAGVRRGGEEGDNGAPRGRGAAAEAAAGRSNGFRHLLVC